MKNSLNTIQIMKQWGNPKLRWNARIQIKDASTGMIHGSSRYFETFEKIVKKDDLHSFSTKPKTKLFIQKFYKNYDVIEFPFEFFYSEDFQLFKITKAYMENGVPVLEFSGKPMKKEPSEKMLKSFFGPAGR
jgi:hypothetical protein